MQMTELAGSRSCRENLSIPKRDSSGPKQALPAADDDRARAEGNRRRK
jgi:hypothetical protein